MPVKKTFELIILGKKYAKDTKFNLLGKIDELSRYMESIDKTISITRRRTSSIKNVRRILKRENKELGFLKKLLPLPVMLDIGADPNKNQKKISSQINSWESFTDMILEDMKNSLYFQHYSMKVKFINALSEYIKNYDTKSPHSTYRYPAQKIIIGRLIEIYYLMTAEIPKCETDRELERGDPDYDIYKGKFYEFLLELRPLIKTWGLNLGTNKGIGRCANTLIEKFKKNIEI